jgi:RNA polymerase sigma-70 factor, ECF subfamily
MRPNLTCLKIWCRTFTSQYGGRCPHFVETHNTFVARIATNRAITHVKRALKLPTSLELDEDVPASEGGPESRAVALDEQSKLASAVRRLPLSYRQTAMLTLEGLTPREIADVLGITANAVSIRMARAKELLRILIGDRS